MFANLTVGKRLVAGFGLAALTVFLIAWISYRNANLLIANEEWVGHTYQVLTKFSECLSQLKDAETGQRGYILTGEENYLEPYKSGVAGVKTTLAELENLSKSPDQQRRIAALTPLVERKLAELGDTIAVRRSQGFDAALKIVVTNAGQTLMHQIRTILAEADQEEESLLRARSAEAHASSDMTMAAILWGGLLGTLVVGAIGWLIIAARFRTRSGQRSVRCEARRPNCRPPPISRPAAPRSRPRP